MVSIWFVIMIMVVVVMMMMMMIMMIINNVLSFFLCCSTVHHYFGVHVWLRGRRWSSMAAQSRLQLPVMVIWLLCSVWVLHLLCHHVSDFRLLSHWYRGKEREETTRLQCKAKPSILRMILIDCMLGECLLCELLCDMETSVYVHCVCCREWFFFFFWILLNPVQVYWISMCH